MLLPKRLRITWTGWLLLFLCHCCPQWLAAHSSLSKIRYAWEQGLTASLVYSLYEDKEGYLWIGTENGLFRFNGRDFKSYTTRDGLPDNEVLSFSESPTGRVWLTPYASKVCYMYRGRFITEATDPLLRKLHFKFMPGQIFFDRSGNTWVCGNYKLIRIDARGRIHEPDHFKKFSAPENDAMVWLDQERNFMLRTKNAIYTWSADTGFRNLGPIPLAYYTIGLQSQLLSTRTGNFVDFKVSDTGISYGPVRKMAGWDSTMLHCSKDSAVFRTRTGIYCLDFRTARVTDSFFTGVAPGMALRTRDGTMWVGTRGGGLYRFFSTPVHSLSFAGVPGAIAYIKALPGGGVQALSDHPFYPFFLRGIPGKGKAGFRLTQVPAGYGTENMHHVFMGQNKKGQWINCAQTIRLLDRPGGKQLAAHDGLSKFVLEEDPEHLLIGSIIGLLRLDKERFSITDVLMPWVRVVTVAKQNGTIFAGTLEGMFAIDSKGKTYRPVDTSLLDGRILALCAAGQDVLWVGNHRAELIGIRNNRIIAVVGQKQGLRCNNISCIKASDSLLWVGTDKGLFAVSRVPPYKIVRHINYTNGLGNDWVTCLDIAEGRIWVGTVGGINYFEESEVFGQLERSRLIINSIRNGWRELQPGKMLELDYSALSVDFDEIDFSGNLRSVFQYQLSPHTGWVTLEASELYFPSLGYGKFTLKIRLMGPDGTPGADWEQEFYYPPPFYLSWWFGVLVAVLFLSLGSWVTFRFYRRARRHDSERLAVQQNLLLLEQMALQAQLNPHFIFNCIATVKYYYNAGQTEEGNRFTDLFTTLIRQTFEMGNDVFISLDKELDYLRKYLEVEQARFYNSFRFELDCQTRKPAAEIPVPAMLLQPVVENAVRHGVRHLPDGTGIISIRIREEAGMITFIITDNGIGIRRTREMKSARAGIPLTSSVVNEKRIDILNRLFGGKIKLEALDLGESRSDRTGTQIVITYPVSINQPEEI